MCSDRTVLSHWRRATNRIMFTPDFEGQRRGGRGGGGGGRMVVRAVVYFRVFGHWPWHTPLSSPFLQWYQSPLTLLHFGNVFSKLSIVQNDGYDMNFSVILCFGVRLCFVNIFFNHITNHIA